MVAWTPDKDQIVSPHRPQTRSISPTPANSRVPQLLRGIFDFMNISTSNRAMNEYLAAQIGEGTSPL